MKKTIFRGFSSILLVVSVLSLGFSAFAVDSKKVFSDVSSGNAHYEAIMDMVEKGIVGGYPDGKFNPDSSISTGELAIMMCRAFYPEIMIKNYTAKSCAQILMDKGVVMGYYDNIFPLATLVTRTMIADILGRQMKFNIIANDYTVTYSDWQTVKKNSRDNVLAIALAGYLNIENNCIEPAAFVTRAEFCEALYHALVINPKPSFCESNPLTGIHLIYSKEDVKNYSQGIYKQVSAIPNCVINSFIKNGWILELTDVNMDKILGDGGSTSSGLRYSECSGITIPKQKYIGARVTDCSAVIIHEFGHYLHLTTGILDQGEVQRCIDSETQVLVYLAGRDFCKTSNSEFFADAFREYCLRGPDAFGKEMPLTKALIEKALGLIGTTN